MLATAAAAALPILVAVLVLGGTAKLVSTHAQTAPGALSRLGPAVLVPEPFTKTAMMICALGEFGLALGLAFADHPVARWLPVAFFSIATYVLWDLRRRRPDVGCGCFGDVSTTPVGRRSIARAMVLTAMAIAVAAAEVTGADALAVRSWPTAAWLGGVVALLLVLSPELEEVIARLRYRAPCEQRPMPAARALSRLRASTAWRTHAGLLESDEPVDSWRELCWRFFVFPARDGAEVVFAVYLSGRRPAVRAAVVSEDGRSVSSLPEPMPVSA